MKLEIKILLGIVVNQKAFKLFFINCSLLQLSKYGFAMTQKYLSIPLELQYRKILPELIFHL